MNPPLRQRFAVDFEYPVYFHRGLFEGDPAPLLDLFEHAGGMPPHRVLAFIDQGVLDHWPRLPEALDALARAHPSRVELAAPACPVPAGEAAKNDYRFTMQIVDQLLEHQLCRHSFVLALGGGAVLDAVGFAAALVHRGLRLIRLPTTVLAQNDAGIGVKNGMNLHGGKNTIGTFAPPYAVINDASFLRTLPEREWRAGIAEAFKVALIRDEAFFHVLTHQAPALRARDAAAMDTLIRRCAELHLAHIATSGDAFEQGTARPLDFGHWAAHKLETLSAYRIGHGDAVAAGIALDTLYAEASGWLPAATREAVHTGLRTCGFPLWYDEMDLRHGDGARQLLDGLDEFREHLGGRLSVTLPHGVGRGRETHDIDRYRMNLCLDRLRKLASTQPTHLAP